MTESRRPPRRFTVPAGAVWGVLDQGIFSVSNFVVSVMLARHTTEGDYGVFAIAFSVLMILSSIQTGGLIEPVLIFGSRRERGRFGSYLRAVTRAQFVAASSVAVLAIGVMLAIDAILPGRVPPVAFAAAVVAPVVLQHWLLRRAIYVTGQIRRAAFSSISYLLALGVGAFALQRSDRLTSATAFLLFGIGSLAVTVALTRFAWERGAVREGTRAVLREAWTYSRYGLPVVLLIWIPNNAYFSVLPFRHGLSSTGALRALMNLVQPAMLAQTALATVVLPRMSRAFGTDGFDSLRRRGMALLVGVGVSYALLMLTAGSELVHLVYRGKYDANAELILPLAILPVIGGFSAIATTTLQATGNIKRATAAWALVATASLAVGVPATNFLGLPGAVWSIVGTQVVAASSLSWSARRRFVHRASRNGEVRRDAASASPTERLAVGS